MPAKKPVHEVDAYGNDIHVDVDPYIPTGLCAICTWEPEWVDPEAPVEEELPPAPEPAEESAGDPEETPAPETTEP